MADKKTSKRDVSVTFHDKPDSSALKGFTEADVARFLATLPKTKYQYGIATLEALEKWTDAKSNTKRCMAGLRMKAKVVQETENLTSDGDRKAWADSHPDMKKALDEELDAEMNFKLAELKYQYLDDLFVAVRKAANRFEQLEHDVSKHDKYRDPEN